jgi:MoxR-like ATPase
MDSIDFMYVKLSDLRPLMVQAIMSRGKINLAIFGMPGVGKTTVSDIIHSDFNIPALFINVPKTLKEHFEPVLIWNPTEQVLKTVLPEIAQFSEKNPEGMIVFDEIGASSTEQQKILLSLIQERRGLGYEISKKLSIFALGNDDDCLGNKQLITAMNDRFSIVMLKVNYITDISEMFLLDFQYNSLEKMLSSDISRNSLSEGRRNNLIIVDDVMKSSPKFLDRFGNIELANSDDKKIARSYLSCRSLTNIVNVLDEYDRVASGNYTDPLYKGIEKEAIIEMYWKIIAGFGGEDFAEAIAYRKLESKLNILNFNPNNWDGKIDSIIEYVDDTYKRNYLITQQMIYLNSNINKDNIYKTIKLINYLVNYNHIYGDYTGENSYNYRFAKKLVELALSKKNKDCKLINLKELQEQFDIYRLSNSIEEKQMLS